MASLANYYLALCDVSYFIVLLIDVLFVFLANIRITIEEKWTKWLIGGIILFMSVMCFAMAQNELYTDMSNISTNGILLNVFICMFFILISIILSGRVFAGIAAGSVWLMLFSSIDYLVYNFRGTEFTPYDVLAIETAMNVAEEYEFPISSNFFLSWSVIALLLVLISTFTFTKVDSKTRLKYYAPTMAIVLVCILGLSGTEVSSRFGNGGAVYRGVHGNFVLELHESTVKKPSGYNIEELSKIDSKYGDNITKGERLPNIIVIMNESFADLQAIGNQFETSEPVLPYLHSLDNNTIKGYAYPSIFGGGTSSSEYEFLTGNSMAFLPLGSIPYQQFVHDESHSMVSVLKRLGYTCQAFHPYFSNGWNREKAYPAMGFDDSFFIDDFPQEDLIRGYVSDEEMYKRMLEHLKEASQNSPVFMLGVTMQNHGGYDDETYNNYITIKDHEGEFPEAEQYLSLINQSDAALKYLIKQLKKTDENTIVVFFGDHQPSLTDGFYDFVRGENPEVDNLNYEMTAYKVPFIIWANYDIDSYNVEKTSLNYLSTYVYEIAGIQSPYSRYLRDISSEIPVINAKGYYSKDSDEFQSIDNAVGREKEVLNQYKRIQYNNLFDKKNRISMFK